MHGKQIKYDLNICNPSTTERNATFLATKYTPHHLSNLTQKKASCCSRPGEIASLGTISTNTGKIDRTKAILRLVGKKMVEVPW